MKGSNIVITRCTCWVADQSPEARFGIRYGAHSMDCPLWRESLDPVDQANDEELRQRGVNGEMILF